MSKLTLTEQASPSTPSAGQMTIYPKTDKELYVKDDAGNEKKLSTDSNAIDSLTGDVVASGPGAAGATIQPNAVTDAKLADMPAHTIKANISGSTGDPVNATPAQVLAEVSPLTTKGDIPTFDTVNTRLAVGSNGDVLTADSAQPKGIKWAAPVTGGITELTGDVLAGPGAGSQAAIVKGADDFNHRGNMTLDAANTLSVNAAASPYTIPIHARLLMVDTSGGAVSLVLPDPATRRSIKIKDKAGTFGTNQCTLTRFAAEQIEGLSSNLSLYANFGNYEFTSDGTNWWKTSPSSNIAERIFAASVSFTFPGGVTKVDAALRPGAGAGGGGGGGGGGFSGVGGGGAGGGSGGGGGSANFTLFPGLTIVPGTSHSMVIGAGGTPGSAGSGGAPGVTGTAGTAGTAGGITSFGALASVGRTSTPAGGAGGALGGGGPAGTVGAGGAGASGGVAGGCYGLFGVANTSSNGATGGNGGAPGATGTAGANGAALNDAYFGGGNRSGGTQGSGGALATNEGGGGGGAGGGIGGFSDASTQALTQSGGTGGNGGLGGAGNAVTGTTGAAGTAGTAGVEGRGGGGGGAGAGGGAGGTTGGSGGNGAAGGAGSDGKIIARWKE